MPRVNPPTTKTLRGWISDFKELTFRETGNAVYCTACDVTFKCFQRSQIDKHVNSRRHSINIGSNSQDNFNRDIMTVMANCNIPWNTLNDSCFRDFLENCCNGRYSNITVPSDTALRKRYLPAESERIKQNICETLRNRTIWLSIHETSDASGRSLACVAVGLLDDTMATERYIIACKQLENSNAKTIITLVMCCLMELWGEKYEESVSKLLLLITDASPHMTLAGKALAETYVNMLHTTCLAGALHRVADKIREDFPKVNQLICAMPRIFRKAPHRVKIFQQMVPHIELPQDPVATRCGTWLEIASYYYCYLEEISSVIDTFDVNDARSIAEVKQLCADPDLTKGLLYIHVYCSRISSAIDQLETLSTEMSSVHAMDIIFDLRQHLFQIPDKEAEKIKTKISAVFNENPGFDTICCIVALLNGGEVDIAPHSPNMYSLRNYTRFMFAPLTTVAIERMFPTLEWVFTEKRRNMTIENVESLLLLHCNRLTSANSNSTNSTDDTNDTNNTKV